MQCEGNCNVRNNGHRGEVRWVVVAGNHSRPMEFRYCEQAIEEDRSNGFEVHVIPDHLDVDSLPELTPEEREVMESLPADLVQRLIEKHKNQ